MLSLLSNLRCEMTACHAPSAHVPPASSCSQLTHQLEAPCPLQLCCLPASLPCPAVEYDYLPAHQCHATLETKRVQGLFFSGQLNGTTGAPPLCCAVLLCCPAGLSFAGSGCFPASWVAHMTCLCPVTRLLTLPPRPPAPAACRLRGGGLPGPGCGDERCAAGAGAGAGCAAARVLLHRHPAG